MGGPAPIEWIEAEGRRLALLVRRAWRPDRTTFVTDPEAPFQIGGVVYPAGSELKRHDHRPIDRRLDATSEALFVWRGRCEVDLYDGSRRLLGTRTIEEGDLIVFLGAGHGFRMIEDTVLLEIKQGPYTGLDEKERF